MREGEEGGEGVKKLNVGCVKVREDFILDYNL